MTRNSRHPGSAASGPQSEIDSPPSQPTELVFSPDGQTLYVAGLGSAKVRVFDAADLEAGVVTKDLIEVGVGPSGLALDQAHEAEDRRIDQLGLLERRTGPLQGTQGAS